MNALFMRTEYNYLACNIYQIPEKLKALERFIFSASPKVYINLLINYIEWLNSALMRRFLVRKLILTFLVCSVI